MGDSNVGKTSILNKFIDGTFTNKMACTINVEFKAKNLKKLSKIYMLNYQYMLQRDKKIIDL